MDKTTKVIISLVGGLAFFVITKDLILSFIISVWLLFALFSLSYQIFLFFSLFLLFYYLVFKNISFVLPAATVVLGLILAVIPKQKVNKSGNNLLPDTRIMGYLLLLAFFLFALLFSYQTYQKQQLPKQETQKEKPVEKVIINLNKTTDNSKQ